MSTINRELFKQKLWDKGIELSDQEIDHYIAIQNGTASLNNSISEEDLSEEELAERLFDQFGDSTLGGEQKETVGIPVPQRFKDNINAVSGILRLFTYRGVLIIG